MKPALLFAIKLLLLPCVLGRIANASFEENLERVLNCIQSTALRQPKATFPTDAEEHHQFLLKKTVKFRNVPVQANGNSQQEPYIEKIFIDHFIDKPIDTFGGMIPLFIQWSDYQLSHRNLSTKSDDYAMFHEILPLLRSDVVYVVVSQANYGIKMFAKRSNVLIFSAGGVGHVPIPLVKGQLNYSAVDVNQKHFTLLGFYGSVDHGPRQALLMELRQVVRDNHHLVSTTPSENTVHHLVIKKGPTWVEDMGMTLFNLAPVGYGRGSYRLSEVVRIGRIPVYLYKDYPWLPYEGTVMSPTSLGLMAKTHEMHRLYQEMNYLLAHAWRVDEYLKRVKDAYHLYTNEGIIEQLELFFQSPFEAGYLRCSKVYQTFKMKQRSNLWYQITQIFSV